MRLVLELLALAGLAITAAGQQTPSQPAGVRRDPHPERALSAPGGVISQGHNDKPVGKLGVKTYRLERVKLDAPFVTDRGSTEYGYRLVITGGPFRLGYTLWLNDLALPVVPNGDGTELVALLIMTAGSELEDGATLALTENARPCEPAAESKSELPEKLSVPPELRAAPHDPSAIKLRSIGAGKDGKPAIGITVTTKEALPVANSAMAIQVGKQSFDAGGGGQSVAAIIPYEEFAKIPDNSQVILKWGRCSPGGMVMGRLNKSSLDH
jgi:hypothetical protein